jgi:hypothetical protein
VDAGVNAPSPLERRGDILEVRRNMGLNSRYQSRPVYTVGWDRGDHHHRRDHDRLVAPRLLS